jgi:hypothetical protein
MGKLHRSPDSRLAGKNEAGVGGFVRKALCGIQRSNVENVLALSVTCLVVGNDNSWILLQCGFITHLLVLSVLGKRQGGAQCMNSSVMTATYGVTNPTFVLAGGMICGGFFRPCHSVYCGYSGWLNTYLPNRFKYIQASLLLESLGR